MARRSGFRSRFRGGYRRARVIVRRVMVRSRSRRRRPRSMFEKNKKVILLVAVAAGLWYFRDKIKAIFNK